ncbi:MAG TPA: cupin domain-containing protein [Candidatus Nitrosotalea sp.]|nr:cupin domain-containing protein [Candidatus Nitrosotalea sp.]
MLISRVFLTIATCAALTAAAVADPSPTIVTPETAKWQQGTGAFKGVQIATLVGDPSVAGGYYAYLIKMPDGIRVAPHFHGMTENVTVLSGTLLVGIGDSMDTATMTALGPGSVASVPANLHHYAMSKGETVIEVSGIGPDSLTPVAH